MMIFIYRSRNIYRTNISKLKWRNDERSEHQSANCDRWIGAQKPIENTEMMSNSNKRIKCTEWEWGWEREQMFVSSILHCYSLVTAQSRRWVRRGGCRGNRRTQTARAKVNDRVDRWSACVHVVIIGNVTKTQSRSGQGCQYRHNDNNNNNNSERKMSNVCSNRGGSELNLHRQVTVGRDDPLVNERTDEIEIIG